MEGINNWDEDDIIGRVSFCQITVTFDLCLNRVRNRLVVLSIFSISFRCNHKILVQDDKSSYHKIITPDTVTETREPSCSVALYVARDAVFK